MGGIVLGYGSRNELGALGHWGTALRILVVEQEHTCFDRIGMVTAFFRESVPFLITSNEEAVIGNTKLSRRRFRLG